MVDLAGAGDEPAGLEEVLGHRRPRRTDLAVGQTVIMLHPHFRFGRCFNRDGEGVSAKMTVYNRSLADG